MRLAPPRLATLGLLLLGLAAPAVASPPGLTGVSPRGFPRGQATTLTLSGDRVGQGSPEVLTTLPATLGPVKVEAPNKISLAVTLAPDAPVGFYPVQVRTADGLSGRLLVAVGDLPEVDEVEPNDERSAAQEIKLPVTVRGRCEGTDRDHVRFSARKGEPIVVEVEARRLGSGLDPALAIFDSRGRELATESDADLVGGDPRLVFSPPEDGTYVLALNDIKFSGAGDPFYRLKVGAFAYAEAAFPLGWKRGETAEVLFLGGNLPAPIRTRVATPADPETAWVGVALPASPVGESPFRLVLGDEPEQVEPDNQDVHPWSVGTVMNGRIAKPDEVDRYKVAVTPGQAIVFDLDAAQLGSKLDAMLRIAKPDGTILAETDDTQGFDPQLTYTAPGDLKEVLVSVEDLLGRGGPSFGYRLKARPAAVDYTLSVASPSVTIPQGAATIVPVRVARQNFNDAIQLSIPRDLSGVSATDGLIAAGAAEGSLVLTAAPGTPTRTVALEIWGEGGPPAQPIRRKARLASDGTPLPPSRPFALAAAVGTGPPITLTTPAASLAFVHGQKATLGLKVNRPAGNKESIAISTAGLPPGVSGGQASIPGDRPDFTLDFNVDSNAALIKSALVVTAKYKVDNREETVTLPPIPASVERPYALEVFTTNPTVRLGQKTPLVGVIRRVAPFEDPVKVAIEGSLPAGISVAPVTVEKGAVLVPMELVASAEAKAGTFDLLLRASTDMPGRKQTKDYIIPDVTVHVTVAPAPASPVASK